MAFVAGFTSGKGGAVSAQPWAPRPPPRAPARRAARSPPARRHGPLRRRPYRVWGAPCRALGGGHGDALGPPGWWGSRRHALAGVAAICTSRGSRRYAPRGGHGDMHLAGVTVMHLVGVTVMPWCPQPGGGHGDAPWRWGHLLTGPSSTPPVPRCPCPGLFPRPILCTASDCQRAHLGCLLSQPAPRVVG